MSGSTLEARAHTPGKVRSSDETPEGRGKDPPVMQCHRRKQRLAAHAAQEDGEHEQELRSEEAQG
jgi:hypothetical protein